jgi:RNA polymerase sigma factor (sigma-70 family)
MTNEELALRIKSGETFLMDELWGQVERFVYKQANKFYWAYKDRCGQIGLEVDDLYQEGYFAIHKAVENFDASLNKTLLTYAGYQLKRRFFDVSKMHSTGWQKNTTYYAMSLDAPTGRYDKIHSTSKKDMALLNVLVDEIDIAEGVIEQIYTKSLGEALEEAMTSLTERQAYILVERYYNKVQPANIARHFGISRTNISRSCMRALARLRTNETLQTYWASA